MIRPRLPAISGMVIPISRGAVHPTRTPAARANGRARPMVLVLRRQAADNCRRRPVNQIDAARFPGMTPRRRRAEQADAAAICGGSRRPRPPSSPMSLRRFNADGCFAASGALELHGPRLVWCRSPRSRSARCRCFRSSDRCTTRSWRWCSKISCRRSASRRRGGSAPLPIRRRRRRRSASSASPRPEFCCWSRSKTSST